MVYFFISNFLFLCLYSFSLIDPNLTLINHPFFEKIKFFFIQFGYFQREKSAVVYLILIIILFLNYFLLIKKEKTNIIKTASIIGVLSMFSYPFLSKDFFNYLFDIKILTFYGKNPYFYKPMDFYQDQWLRFMHWTHRSYPYGPVFLVITLVPSFLGFGKFILNFLFFKIVWVFFYLLVVYFLNKINRKLALTFAFHPLVLIEGLINNHNDLIAVSLAIVGIYFVLKNKNLLGRFFLILSFGIKYLTLPLVFISKKLKKINILLAGILFLFLFYLFYFKEIQPWYFLNLFILLPLFPKIIDQLNIFLFGLLVSYYPYLRFDFWNAKHSLVLKHKIILFFLILNFLFTLKNFLKRKK